MQPLDIGLNVAVNHIASRLFPTGFSIGPDAPQTFEALCERLDKPHARMLVWDGASDQTIFADAETNYAFRAWHDWCHWRGRHPFTREGELAACRMQCEHVFTLYGISPMSARWALILHAEVMGQREYADAHNGEFPTDQRAFVEQWLADGFPLVETNTYRFAGF